MRGHEGPERRDSKRNHDAILDAAIEVFGVDPEAPIEDVAKAAGLARKTVYRHFETRELLLRATARRMGEAAGPMIEAMSELPLADAVAFLAGALIELGQERRAWLRHAQLDELASAAVPGDPLAPWIAARRAGGEITSPAPDRWLSLCVRRLCLAALDELGAGELAPDVVRDALRHTLTDLLAPPGASPSA